MWALHVVLRIKKRAGACSSSAIRRCSRMDKCLLLFELYLQLLLLRMYGKQRMHAYNIHIYIVIRTGLRV